MCLDQTDKQKFTVRRAAGGRTDSTEDLPLAVVPSEPRILRLDCRSRARFGVSAAVS
jgi:hypothetical protein